MAHPDLLGQCTGAGPIYELDETEQILNLIVKTTKPRRKVMARPPLSQIVSITIVTNARIIHLGPGAADASDQSLMPRRKVVEVFWEFNAMFDWLRFVYK